MPRLLIAGFVLLTGWGVSSYTLAQIRDSDAKLLTFDVASIKPSTSGDARTTLGFETPRHFRAINETLRRLIGEGYGTPQALPAFRIVEGPSWLDADRFDVDARTERDTTPQDRQAMLRAFLADRFKLIAHIEKRELPAFALRLVRKDGSFGPQLRRADIDCAALRASGTPPPPSDKGRPCVMEFGFGRSGADGLTINELATVALSRFAGRTVVDETGLNGAFQWTLTWTPDNLPPRAPGTTPDQPVTVNGLTVDPNGPSLFTALQEQLGLKLESTKARVDVVVIDHAEKPMPD